VMALPDMTAHWESQLEAIAQKRMSYNAFMTPMLDGLHQLVEHVGQIRFTGLQGQGKASPWKRSAKKRTKAQA